VRFSNVVGHFSTWAVALVTPASNRPPVVTASDASGNEGAAIAIHGTAADPDGDPSITTWTHAPSAGVDPGAS
jgi:hypothetical protein